MADTSAAAPTIMQDYLRLTENTEACTLFHRWSFLACTAAFMGRNMFLPFGPGAIYPPIYVMLMGDAGTRKSSAVKCARKILERTGYDSFASDRVTKEKFLLDLEGKSEDGLTESEDLEFYDETLPREKFIVNDEFNEFIGLRNMNFISTLGVMWDCPDKYEDRVKNSKSVSINQPTVSILGGNTPTNFALAFPPEILGQGFFSRILLIHGERSSKRFTIPPPLDSKLMDSIINRMHAAKAQAMGTVSLTEEARKVLDYIYLHEQDYHFKDSRFASYHNRRFVHMLRLSLIHAALRGTKILTPEIIIEANTVLAYAERFMPQALGEFGRSKNSEVANSVMQILFQSPGPLGLRELWGAVSSHMGKMEDLAQLLANLEQADKIGHSKDAEGTKFFPIRQVANLDLKYVDFSLLSAEEQEKCK